MNPHGAPSVPAGIDAPESPLPGRAPHASALPRMHAPEADGRWPCARAQLHNAIVRTGGVLPGGVSFMLHDFGYRGVSSVESAAIGGAAHLVNFCGSDTIAALQCVRRYYHGGSVPSPVDPSIKIPVAALSIPAAEHSTITSWGREGELDAFRNMLTQYPEGPVAVVSDSYNVFEACSKLWGSELKDMIKERRGKLIVRPDSGDPPVIIPQLLALLGEAFAEDVTITSTGHKLLPPYLGMIQASARPALVPTRPHPPTCPLSVPVAPATHPATHPAVQCSAHRRASPFFPVRLQGDGISFDSLGAILDSIVESGWAAENVAFGSGGALLQKLNRDTQKCAFKCSEIAKRDGSTTEVYKDPITDKGKASKRGKLVRWPTLPASYTQRAGSGERSRIRCIAVARIRFIAVARSWGGGRILGCARA